MPEVSSIAPRAPRNGGEGVHAPLVALPDRVAVKLAEFLLDKRTGNVVLNVKDGVIKGVHLTEIIPA